MGKADIVKRKVNYELVMERELERIAMQGMRPKLALHACCAPCSSSVLERLGNIFDIYLYFFNPNIGPEDEFRRRLEELRELLVKNGRSDVTLVEGSYEPERFYALARGLENEPEGGERCRRCFELRLRETAAFAISIGADYFTTTLTIGRLKDAQLLNELGGAIAAQSAVKYLFSDFKKKNGCERACELSQLYGLYRQDYCGCVFSKREQEEKHARGQAQLVYQQAATTAQENA